jgi:hypothetical protein
MTPAERETLLRIHRDVIRPVHAGLAREFGIPDGPAADAMSIACGFQESRFATRDQRDAANAIGPATGWWQFEKNGGVAEILEARQTRDVATELCRRAGVKAERDPVWRLFASAAGDELACAFARLLVWKDPAALPSAAQEAYAYYDRNWRPGKKRPQDWPASWAVALEIVGALPSQPAPAVGWELDLPARVARLEREVAALKAARPIQGNHLNAGDGTS